MKRFLLSTALMATSNISFAHDAHTTESVFSNIMHLLTAPDHLMFMLVAGGVLAAIALNKRFAVNKSKNKDGK